MTPNGFHKDPDGRVLSNGCRCVWHNSTSVDPADIDHGRHVPSGVMFDGMHLANGAYFRRGHWNPSGCPVHDTSAARAAAPRQPLRSVQERNPAG